MLSMKRVRKKYGDYICRACLNEAYHVRLKRENCKYGYMYRCPRCGENKNIVVHLTPGGRLKTLFRF